MDWYNNNCINRFKLSINDIYHDLDEVNKLSMNDEEELIQENVDKINDLLINNDIKKRECYDDNINFSQEEMDIIDLMIGALNDKLSMKSLIYGVESKIYHQIFERVDTKTRILMNARRSDKCMSFLNNYYGVCNGNKLFLSNKEFDNILRILFGITLFDVDINVEEERKCKHCGEISDGLGLHAFMCRHGKSHIYAHDAMNRIIYNLLKSEILNCRLEKRPIDNNKKRDKPDIIIDDNISLVINKKCKNAKFYLDTIIYDIYRDKHFELFEKADANGGKGISIFSAGKLGEKEKYLNYKNKFEDLRNKNYIFVPICIESMGGISKNLKKIINYIITVKAVKSGKDKNILLNNYYVTLSMNFKKIMLIRLYDHLNI